MNKHIPEDGIRCLKDAEQFLLATSSKRNSKALDHEVLEGPVMQIYFLILLHPT